MLSHKYSIVHEIFVILFVVKKSLKQSILANVQFSLIMNQSILIFPTTSTISRFVSAREKQHTRNFNCKQTSFKTCQQYK